MLDIGNDGLVLNRTNRKNFSEEELENMLSHPDDQILYYVATALKAGFSVERINNLSAIDPWFIEKIKNIVKIEEKIKGTRVGENLCFGRQKKAGFSDKQIRACKRHRSR